MDIARADTLSKWFGHKPSRWEGFQTRYRAELDKNHAVVDHLRDAIGKGSVTLLCGAHDETHNNAAALAAYLTSKRK